MSTELRLHIRPDNLSREDVEWYNKIYVDDLERYNQIEQRLRKTPQFVVCDTSSAPEDIVATIDMQFMNPVELTQSVLMHLVDYGEWLGMRAEIEAFLRPHLGKDVFSVIW